MDIVKINVKAKKLIRITKVVSHLVYAETVLHWENSSSLLEYYQVMRTVTIPMPRLIALLH